MAVRFGIIGESEQECLAGLALLAQHGIDVVVMQKPSLLSDQRWMARVMPTAPAGEGQGRG